MNFPWINSQYFNFLYRKIIIQDSSVKIVVLNLSTIIYEIFPCPKLWGLTKTIELWLIYLEEETGLKKIDFV